MSSNTPKLSIDSFPGPSITLYPNRALVVSHIPASSLSLIPGVNKLVIAGLSPQLLPDSVRISGTGLPGRCTVTETTCLISGATSSAEVEAARFEKARLQEALSRNSAQSALLTKALESAAAKLVAGGVTDVAALIRAQEEQGEQLWQEKQRLSKRVKQQLEIEAEAGKGSGKYELTATIDVREEDETEERPTVEGTVTKAPPRKEGVGKAAEVKEEQEEPGLKISYVVEGGVSWSPRYDVQLDTTTGTGTVTYRAVFTNNSGQDWNDAEITLSTNQNTFQGVDDRAPDLEEWRVRMGRTKRTQYDTDARYSYSLESSGDMSRRKRSSLAGGFGGAARMKSMSLARGAPELAVARSALGPATRSAAYGDEEEYDWDSDDSDVQTRGASSNLQLLTTTAAPHGTTTTYSLPGKKTLISSPEPRHHTVAELPVSDVTFVRTSVPKLRSAVFLAASITNPSTETTLLKGTAGVTLDGAYLGTFCMPRCFPGEKMTVPLGIDEGISVHYGKPSVKTAVEGMLMMREQLETWTRTITINNARSQEASITVLDQVPQSTDDRLKISLVHPERLRTEGDEVKTDGGGDVVAKLGKGGEIRWDVRLKESEEVKLMFKYEARTPTGERALW